jgi:site-specific DNA-methyltransferase (adenine-specific)
MATQQPQIDIIQSIQIPLAQIDNNVGQIPGVKENPREMTVMEFKKLKRSLQRDARYTAVCELKVYQYQGRWVAIGGNMRLRAMIDLGWEKAPCKPLPDDTDAETLNRWILLDNANFGRWDFDKLANQWSEETLAEMNIDIPDTPDPETEEEAKDDNCDVEALKPKTPTTKLGDIWQLGEHRLICGDSTKARYIDALMQDEEADLIVTDPPYNVDYEGKTKDALKIENDKMSDASFVAFLSAAFANANAHLRVGGAFYIWHADSNRRAFLDAMAATNWPMKQIIIWNKNQLVLGRQDYQWKHEPCIYGWKEGAAHYFINRRDLTTVVDEVRQRIDEMSKDELKEALQTIIRETPTTVIDEAKPLRSADHPTMKPVPLIGQQVRNSSRAKDIVLDIFGGSGTTLIACEQLSRQCRIIEFAPEYCDVIIRRWEEFTTAKAQYIGNIDTNQADNTETKTK